jgi:outer membrane protein TolC
VVALTVTTNVADTYLATLALRQRLGIARQNVDVAKRTLDTVRAKLSHGTATQLDIEQQETLLANADAAVPALEEQEREARYTLAILLGRVPEDFDVQGDSVDAIRSHFGFTPAGAAAILRSVSMDLRHKGRSI